MDQKSFLLWELLTQWTRSGYIWIRSTKLSLAGDIGARILYKGIVYLYAYLVIFFKLNVSDYPNIVGNPLIFYRMPYFWACQRLAGLSGLSVKGDYEIFIKQGGQTCWRHLADKVVDFLQTLYLRALLKFVTLCWK